MSTCIQNISDWIPLRDRVREQKRTIGFVPTMGALHAGHLSLLKRCRAENDVAVLSIFLNPTQFNDPKDLEKYPKTLARDLAMAQEAGIDWVLTPDVRALYPDDYRYKVSESTHSAELCGAHRPGHFDGVLTVVMKLLMLVLPNKSYFGEKDYQQFLLVKGMVQAFFLATEIVPCETVREPDGLAMSSRNVNLDPVTREKASRLYAILKQSTTAAAATKLLEENGFAVEYVEDRIFSRERQ